jgi:hypothetical protein
MRKFNGMISIAAVLAMVLLMMPAAACYDPQDDFATEVVLNKEGIGHDLSKLKGNVETAQEDGAFIYRSHVDKDVAVALFEVTEGDAKGLSVRVAIPIKEGEVTYVYTRKVLEHDQEVELTTDLEKAMGDLGYDQTGEGWENDRLVMLDFSKGDQHISVAVNNGKVSTDGTKVEAMSEEYDEATDQDVKAMLEELGVDGSAWDEADLEKKKERTTGYVPKADIDPDEFEWSEALTTELVWLRDVGVITGITDSDIDAIGNSSKRGTAGYNGRLVHHDGDWVPFTDSGPDKGVYERCGGGPDINHLPGDVDPIPLWEPALLIGAVIAGAAFVSRNRG